MVKSLKSFARLDEAEYQQVDVHEGIDSCLTLIESEWRGQIDIIREYESSGEIVCYASQLNQVFIILLKNAIAAMDAPGTIRIQTHSFSSRATRTT